MAAAAKSIPPARINVEKAIAYTGGAVVAPERAVAVVCFDLDDTLWPCAPVLEGANMALQRHVEAVYPAPVAAALARSRIYAHIRAMLDPSNALHAAHKDRVHDLTHVRQEALRLALLNDPPSPLPDGLDVDAVVDECMRVWRDARDQVVFFDGAVDTLRTLRDKGYELATITNGNSRPERMPELAHIRVHVTAAAAGASKPAPAPFLRVLSDAGVPHDRAHTVVHVGDDLHSDVSGAAPIGMRAVWLDTHMRTHGRRPDAAAQASMQSLTVAHKEAAHTELAIVPGTCTCAACTWSPDASDASDAACVCVCESVALCTAMSEHAGTVGQAHAVIHHLSQLPAVLDAFEQLAARSPSAVV